MNKLREKIKYYYSIIITVLLCITYFITTNLVEFLFTITPLGIVLSFGWFMVKKSFK